MFVRESLPSPCPRRPLEGDFLLHDGDGGGLGQDLRLHVHGERAVRGVGVPVDKEDLLQYDPSVDEANKKKRELGN